MGTLTYIKHYLGLTALILLSLACNNATAQASPTPDQIEKFKRLPPAQQRALAQSLGVDIDEINALIDVSGTPGTKIEPREEISGARSLNIDSDIDLEEENALGEKTKKSLTEETEDTLRPFGYDLFNLGADAFTPASDIPIPYDYVLGPGDTLVIQLYGKESGSYNLTINRDGTIQFPDIGPVSLAGLRYSEAVSKIEEIVREQMIGIKSSVTMGQLRTIRIFVLGEANIPGSYVVGSLSTMTNAIFASGGISTIGSLRNIQLKRAGKIITNLDLYDLLLKGDTSGDSRLRPGDVIFIPPVGKTASADGAVKRPAIYELKHERTAQDLLKLAGGLKATAYLPASKVERIATNGERTLVEINLNGNTAISFTIQDADSLYIGSTLDSITDTVNIMGHVKREGTYAWKPSMRFTDIIQSSDQLKALPDLNLALIEREIPGSREIEVLTFSPLSALSNPQGKTDPKLRARDKILIFGYEKDRSEIVTELVEKLSLQANFENKQKTVRVDGSIRFPGEYPYSVDMSAKDLVMLAGGYTESALGRDAEITRYDLSENRERVILHISVDLQSEDPVMLEGDTLRVQQIPLWRDKEAVTLEGEFLQPGTYSILPGETLIDVIKRAGGLTADAYPDGTIFSRAELRDLETQRLNKLKEEVASDIAASRLESSSVTEDVNEAQAKEIIENIEGTEALGRMVIDLPAIIKTPKDLDFQLINGDTVTVPRYKPSITVVGEVQYSTSHFFDNRLSVKDYLSRSGGLKRDADKKRIYVVKANGMVIQPKGSGWFGGRDTQLSPGDTIVVPLNTRRVDKITLWASVTRIMYEAALGVAALNSF